MNTFKLSKYKKKNNHNKKTQKGGSNKVLASKIIDCTNPYLFFNNTKGTCWMISIFMIILSNNNDALLELQKFTKELFLQQLYNNEYIYLDNLPEHFFNNKIKSIDNIKPIFIDHIINFFLVLQKRFINKTKQSKSSIHELFTRLNNKKNPKPNSESNKRFVFTPKPNRNTNPNSSKRFDFKPKPKPNSERESFKLNEKLKRYPSLPLFNESSTNESSTNNRKIKFNSCEKELNNHYFIMFNENENENENENNNLKYGGSFDDSYYLINLLSIFLCKKLYNLRLYNFSNRSLEDIIEIVGIQINIQNNHSVCFYKCKDKLMFCNNDFITEYDWYNLLLKFHYQKDRILYYNECYSIKKLKNIDNKKLFYFKDKDKNIYYDLDNNIVKIDNIEYLLDINDMLIIKTRFIS